MIFLDARIPHIVSNFPAQYGVKLKNKFLGENCHPHSTLLNKLEFRKLPLEMQEMVVTKYQEEEMEVEMTRLVALTKGNEVLIGSEIKLPEADCIRRQVGSRPTVYSHIITSHMWKNVYYRSLEPVVGRLVGIVYVYCGTWDEVGKDKMKTWVEKDRAKKGKYHQ